MLRKEFVRRKVKLIQEDLAKLEPLGRFSFTELEKDWIKYAASERYLERIVTRAIDINRHLLASLGKGNEVVREHKDTFLRLADLGIAPAAFAKTIAPSAGLRNVLVHAYDEVDPHEVYASIGEALIQYAKYCDLILRFLKKH